jgi:hypothetical protein
MQSSGLQSSDRRPVSRLYLGVLKFGPFTQDIDLLTPTWATYRHAGQELLLSSAVPRVGVDPVAESRVAGLAHIVVMCEQSIRRRFREVMGLLDNHLGTLGLPLPRDATSRSFADVRAAGRWDAAFHAAAVSPLLSAVRAKLSHSLAELVESGDITRRREQNLQFTAIAHSVKHDDRRPGAYRLIEPNFIAEDFSIPRHRWLSCPHQLATLEDGSVLMSAEGSIGYVAVYRSEPDIRSVSNIHGISMRWDTDRDPVARNCLLAANLAYLREKGLLDAWSVGGQGGSLALRYHDVVPILDFDPELAAACERKLAGGAAAPTAEQLSSADPMELGRCWSEAREFSTARLDELRRNAADALRDVIAHEYEDLYPEAVTG